MASADSAGSAWSQQCPRGPGQPHTAREAPTRLDLGEALGRAERIVAREVGRQIAIRSAMAVFASSDCDPVDVVLRRAARLDRVLDQTAAGDTSGGDAVRALRLAADAARRAIESGEGRVYASGTARDVVDEVERVIAHLAVVVGVITLAERNRLVVDAQLAGFDHERARVLVHDLIQAAGVDGDGLGDTVPDRTATVVVSPGRCRLMPGQPALDELVTGGEAAIRVLLLDP